MLSVLADLLASIVVLAAAFLSLFPATFVAGCSLFRCNRHMDSGTSKVCSARASAVAVGYLTHRNYKEAMVYDYVLIEVDINIYLH